MTACDYSPTMVAIAEQIATANSAPISLISSPSTSLHISHPHLRHHFNLIVSEVYDSVLVGEGCLTTYRHALTFLASEDCIMIPRQATLYLQPFTCPSLTGYSRTTDGDCMVCCESLVQPWEVHTEQMRDLQMVGEVVRVR